MKTECINTTPAPTMVAVSQSGLTLAESSLHAARGFHRVGRAEDASERGGLVGVLLQRKDGRLVGRRRRRGGRGGQILRLVAVLDGEGVDDDFVRKSVYEEKCALTRRA